MRGVLMANNKKQKLMIQDLLSSLDVYVRTAGIIKPEYFDGEYEPIVRYIHEYYDKYRATPSIDQLDAEFDVELEETKKITRDRVEYTCDEIERFCRETAVKDAFYESLQDIEDDKMSVVLNRVTQAIQISLQKDTGIDMYEDPENTLRSLIEKFTPIPTGIDGIDAPLGGGLVRQQFTLFSANSGGGKSIMLANIGKNYASQNLNVLYITLELPEEMVYLRNAAIISGIDASIWKEHIPEIAEKILDGDPRKNGGSYVIKRLPQQSTASDIRAYLAHYEAEYNCMPDVLLVDYLDLMAPNRGISSNGIFEQDKQKAEEVNEIIFEYNMIGISASQQNRDGITIGTPNQSIIAGGISKVNTVDNYISIFMDDTMRLDGVMNAYFLKTRSSRGVGHCAILEFNPHNLRITDPGNSGNTGIMPVGRKASVANILDEINGPVKQKSKTDVTIDLQGLPGLEDEDIVGGVVPPPEELFDDEEPRLIKSKVTEDKADSLMDLMTSLQ
jgi:archaellum biogenesis ATPase FlaH